MNVNLMKTKNTNNTINKKISSLVEDKTTGEFEGYLREECSIIDPIIDVPYISQVLDANYVYIPEFERYYFINNYVFVNSSTVRIYLHVDVLMSFKEKIYNCSGIVERNEKGNYFIDDNSLVATNESIINTFNFPKEFDTENPEYVLITAGR